MSPSLKLGAFHLFQSCGQHLACFCHIRDVPPMWFPSPLISIFGKNDLIRATVRWPWAAENWTPEPPIQVPLQVLTPVIRVMGCTRSIICVSRTEANFDTRGFLAKYALENTQTSLPTPIPAPYPSNVRVPWILVHQPLSILKHKSVSQPSTHGKPKH